MTSELKPCPFCGANARMWASNRDDKEIIGCSNHLCVIEPTTEEYMDKDKAADAWNTRAVPDVPELVRYRLNSLGELVYSENGSYVLHSQAAEIIAAERSEKHRAQEAVLKLERELAQHESQEPVAWMHPEAGWTDVCKVTVANHCKHGIEPLPLYASPAPAADLRAENERLREALKPFAEYMHTDEGRLDLDNLGNELPDNDHVGWLYLNHKDFRAARAALNVEASNDKA